MTPTGQIVGDKGLASAASTFLIVSGLNFNAA